MTAVFPVYLSCLESLVKTMINALVIDQLLHLTDLSLPECNLNGNHWAGPARTRGTGGRSCSPAPRWWSRRSRWACRTPDCGRSDPRWCLRSRWSPSGEECLRNISLKQKQFYKLSAKMLLLLLLLQWRRYICRHTINLQLQIQSSSKAFLGSLTYWITFILIAQCRQIGVIFNNDVICPSIIFI